MQLSIEHQGTKKQGYNVRFLVRNETYSTLGSPPSLRLRSGQAQPSPIKAVRGRFLNILGLEAHDYWISATKDNNPLYPPFLRGNPSNSKRSWHLPIGVRRENLPLTAHQGGRGSDC